MSDNLDRDNLLKIADECDGVLREDIIQAMNAAADEINRLQEVVRRLQAEKRALKAQR
jgi:hypothetical protein